MDTAILVAIIAGVPGLIAAVLVFRQSGRANDVNSKAQELSWVKELRQDAIDTRKEMEALQAKVSDLSRQLTATQREADHWFTKFASVQRVAHRPTATIDLVREIVGAPPVDPPPLSNGARPL